ncbi:acyltransferase [Pseudomonas sp. PB106]|uniref:acyltransferase family protein n=1 Tax=Pseudomonas sp. PB106 TaxID=2494699 RepID=UPI00131DCC56|nr:acyltransferase [Pseudomonas sp. PB106]KAE9649121.1 acyltransferase [Pseudomonas sp. PB106]
MGAFRLLLAVLVAVSHMGVTFYGLNPGVVAVISFLIISGFVMTSLIERNYCSTSKFPAFYLDRALRLYPQFLFYFIASCIVVHELMPGSAPDLELTVPRVVASLTIVPLDFSMFGISSVWILPPAWSLGLEMCFYLVIPFLLVFKWRGAAFVLSVGVFLLACFAYINTDYYGYRLLPGVLFMFLCGSYLYKANRRGLAVVAATAIGAGLLLAAIMAGVIERQPFNAEVTLGTALGIPAVYWLSRLKYHRLDEFLGNLSYGVFLNHFVLIYALHGFWSGTYDAAIILAVLLVAFLCSGLTYYCIERPALKLRHRLRAGMRPGAADVRYAEALV